MASVDLIIYGVKLSETADSCYSLLEFNSPITYTDSETGIKRKLFLNEGDEKKFYTFK